MRKIVSFMVIFFMLGSISIFAQAGATGRARTAPTFTLDITVQPRTAQIIIDNVPQTGRSFTLPAGTYNIRVAAPGFIDFTQSLALSQNQTLNVVLQPVLHDLSIQSNVQGARVFINNNEVGQANLVTRLNPGTYAIRLTAPGFQDYTTNLVLGSNQTLNVVMIPQTGKLSFEFPNQLSNVFYFVNDNRFQVNSRDGRSEVELPPGTHRIRFMAGGLESAEFSITVQPGQQIRIRPVLSVQID